MSVSDHREVLVKRHTFFRSQLEQLARRVGPQVFGKTAVEVTSFLQDEINRMMQIWADGGSYDGTE